MTDWQPEYYAVFRLCHWIEYNTMHLFALRVRNHTRRTSPYMHYLCSLFTL